MRSQRSAALRISGVVLPGEQHRQLYIMDRKITTEPIAWAEPLAESGWILPGLVDAHCHLGLRIGGSAVASETEARELAIRDRASGVLAVRDAGSPVDYPAVYRDPGLPRVVRAGRHLAGVGRYLPGVAHECLPSELPDAVRRQASRGDGWVKLIADWLDPTLGELALSWDEAAVRAAVKTAHEMESRVAAHTFGGEAAAALIAAGVDSIEHGTGLTSESLEIMSRQGIALVPTMLAVATFRAISAVAAAKYPKYAAYLRDAQERFPVLVRNAYEAGVPIFVGTDAGSEVAHGRIVDEILLLHRHAGIPAADVLAGASWRARKWLGLPGLDEGDPADLVVYRKDPRLDLAELRTPSLVMMGGAVVC